LPLEIGLEVSNVPEEYREIVSFWQKPSENDHEPFCFSEQLKRWDLFCDSQRLGRERMPIYIYTLNKRLTKHGFIRTFHPDQDPMRQDNLTTWIEYLNYEYRWHDEFIYLIKSGQKSYDRAWNRLVDSKVLIPGETEEFICRREIVSELAGEMRRAESKVRLATSAVTMYERHINLGHSEALQTRLLEAQFDLDAAQKERDSINRRSTVIKKFLKRTMYLRYWKKRLDHHSILLRWVLQQIPIIELELNPQNTNQETSETYDKGGKLRQRRADSPSHKLDEQRDPKNEREEGNMTKDSPPHSPVKRPPCGVGRNVDDGQPVKRSGHEPEEGDVAKHSQSHSLVKRPQCGGNGDDGQPDKRPRHVSQSPSLLSQAISGLTNEATPSKEVGENQS
jgi:hypothetical protein